MPLDHVMPLDGRSDASGIRSRTMTRRSILASATLVVTAIAVAPRPAGAARPTIECLADLGVS
jgi:hypothetical protein